jgi:hypothetical protein
MLNVSGFDRTELMGLAKDELANMKPESRRMAGQILLVEVLDPVCMSLEEVGDMDVIGGAINSLLVSAISLICLRTGRKLLDETPTGGAHFPNEIEAHIVEALDPYLKPVA